MSHQEILEKAIQKAINGGWKGSPYDDYMRLAGENWKADMVLGEGLWLVAIVYSPPHDFAKALWSQGIQFDDWYNDNLWTHTACCSGAMAVYGGEQWQSQLQQMVIADDPIAYLGDNL